MAEDLDYAVRSARCRNCGVVICSAIGIPESTTSCCGKPKPGRVIIDRWIDNMLSVMDRYEEIL